MLPTIDPRPSTYHSASHEIAVVSIVCLAQLLNQAGATQCLPMMNALDGAFSNVTATDKLWFLGALPLTSGAFILISGKFGDLWGLKRVLLGGIIWCTIWTLITGLSTYTDSVVFFCICRAMHGLGLAFALPSAIGVVGSTYPTGQRKAIVFSFIGAMPPLGASAGAVFGGLMTTFGHWEWVLYSNSIAFAILGIAAYFYVPSIPPHAPPNARMDWIGSVTGVAGLILFNVASNQAAQVGWGTPYIIVLLILGIVSLVAFFLIENRVEWPVLPKQVRNAHIGIILAVVLFGWSSFSVFLFYYWSFCLNLREYTPLGTGATYATFTVFGCIAAATVGIFIRRVRPSFLMFAATCGFLIGIAMLATTPVEQTYWQMTFPQMIILSFGMDMSFPASSLVLSDSLPKAHQGMASSLVSTMTNYGMSVSLGFAATAEVEVLKRTKDTLKSYRAAIYVGIGFAVIGCLLALALILMSYVAPETEDVEESGVSTLDQAKEEDIEVR